MIYILKRGLLAAQYNIGSTEAMVKSGRLVRTIAVEIRGDSS